MIAMDAASPNPKDAWHSSGFSISKGPWCSAIPTCRDWQIAQPAVRFAPIGEPFLRTPVRRHTSRSYGRDPVAVRPASLRCIPPLAFEFLPECTVCLWGQDFYPEACTKVAVGLNDEPTLHNPGLQRREPPPQRVVDDRSPPFELGSPPSPPRSPLHLR